MNIFVRRHIPSGLATVTNRRNNLAFLLGIRIPARPSSSFLPLLQRPSLISYTQAIGVLDPTICRERLDLGLVASVGLVADKVAFERKEIRTRTGLL